jgi:hypothetical protein
MRPTFYSTVCDAKKPVFARGSYGTTKGVSRTAIASSSG